MMHFGRFRILAAGAALAAVLAANPALSATPADTLVQAWAIDDTITLDPAESFELSPAEFIGNAYDMLVRLDINDTSKVVPGVAESWTVSDDGLTYTFKLKKDIKFASGNPITSADVAYSFERAVRLDKSPAFILTQFGLTKDNINEKAKAVDDNTFVFTVDKPYAPSFVLNCLTATVAAVVDKKLLEEHAEKVTPTDEYKYDTDYANAWLKTKSAGSGPFVIREWRANEVVILERNDNFYGEKAKLKRVFYRHVKESATQRLMLESGDVDVARNLEPGDYEAVQKNDKLATTSAAKGTVYYISLNQKNENLAKPEVREAFKYLVDYDAIGSTLIKGIGEIRQTYQAKGVLGSLDAAPYKLDVAKAKELLAKAGYANGFDVEILTYVLPAYSAAVQSYLGAVGIRAKISQLQTQAVIDRVWRGESQLNMGSWGSYSINDVAAIMPVYFGGTPDDYSRDPEVQKLIADAGRTNDEAKRKEFYSAAIKKITENAYWMPLHTYVSTYAMSKQLKMNTYPDEMHRYYEATWV